MMSEFAHSLAVVIGINNYQNGINSLKTAVPDAQAIADLLKTKQGYEIFPEVILDAAATCDRLKTLLKEELPKQVSKGDRVLFYFAGHGVALDGHDGPEGYLVPQDAKPGDKGSMLPMQMLHDALAALDCQHLLLILDCCFAGAFRWSANYRDVGLEEELNEQRYQYFIKQPAWQIITSAGSNERAIDVLALGDQRGQIGNHSPFAQVLLDALAGAADRYPAPKNGKPAGDGVITANELITYIESEFKEQLQHQAIDQTPGLWCFRKHTNGRYIFDNPDHPHRALKDAPLLDESTNPYRGLASFEKKDKDLFFGRRELTDILTEFVKQRSLTVVLGTSGSGKSSLVKAGLIPSIEALQNGQRWAILPFRPEHSPFASLNQVLGERGLPKIKNPLQPNSLEPAADLEHPLEQTLSAWLQDHSDTQLLVVIDQFEELVTLSGSKERQLFLEVLANAIVKYAKQLHLVITLRSDFEPQFKESPLAPFWNNANFFITTPMSRANLRQAIENPAAKRTFFFESDDPKNSLVDRLINEVEGMPGALPLLSFALSQLYLNYLSRQEATRQKGLPAIDRAITEADYQKLGSVQQSITRRADDIYDQLREGRVSEGVLEKVRQKFRESSLVDVDSVKLQIEQICQSGVSDRVIRNVMLRMVSTTGIARSRRPVQPSELEYPEPDCILVAIVLETFEQERLLTTNRDAEGNAYIEPAHDALILNWSKINLWLNERQDMVEPKPQFALLPSLKTTLKLTTPTSPKNPNVASDLSSKPASLQSEDLLKVNLELQRELTISANKWENARKDESEGKIQTQKNGGEQPKKAVDWLWDDDPRLPIIERIDRSTDTWLNKVEKEFVEESVLQKRRHRSRGQRIAVAVMLGLSGLTITAFYQLQQVQRQRVEQLAATAKALLATQPIEAKVNALAAWNLSQSTFVQLPDYPRFVSVEGSVLDAIQGTSEQTRLGHKSGVWAIAFSPDGRTIVSGSKNKMVRLWDAKTGAAKGLPLTGHTDQLFAVAFSPDGQTIVSGSRDNTVRLWDAKTGAAKGLPLTGHESSVTAVAFSPDGQTIVSGSYDKTVRLWDVKTGAAKGLPLRGHKDQIWAAAFSPDGQTIVSGSIDNTVRLWDAKTGAAKGLPLTGHKDSVTAVAFSPNGQTIVSGSYDKTVRLWDAKTGAAKEPSFTGHKNAVNSVAFSPDGQTIVSGSYDKTVRLWDAKTGAAKEPSLTGHENSVTAVAFSPDGRTIASGSIDNTVRLWDAQTSAAKGSPWKKHTASVVTAVAFSPDGQTIVSGSRDDNTVRLWNAKTGAAKGLPLTGHKNSVNSVAFSPDGQTIVSGSYDKTVRLWDAKTGAAKGLPLRGHKDQIWAAAFSPDGQTIVSGSKDNTVRLWDAKTGAAKGLPLTGHTQGVNSVAFSPDGRTIASGSRDMRLWDAQTGAAKGLPLTDHEDGVNSVAFSPDGQTIVSSSYDTTVRLWDAKTGVAKGRPLTGHSDVVWAVAFSPDGQTIVSGSRDNTVRLWDAKTGAAKGAPLTGHESVVTAVAFSPDGQTIVSGSYDKTVRLWDATIKSWLYTVCHQLQYHPILTNPTTDIAKEALSTCQKLVWNSLNQSDSSQPISAAVQAFAPQASIQPQRQQPSDEAASVPFSAPTPSPRSTPTPSPQRYKRGEIQFPRGATSTKVSGKLKPRDTDIYTFTASAGQVAKLTSTGQVSLQLLTHQEKPLKLNQGTVTLPISGSYTVKVVNRPVQTASSYTLGLKIDP
jgi:WD40 repeat protein